MTTHIALILETNNLQSMEDSAEVEEQLVSLLEHLHGQTLPLSELAEVVVTHDGLDPQCRRRIDAAAGRELTWVELGADTGYYDAKRAGFEASSAEVVVFGDTDCWPADVWLERLASPFADPEVGVVAGRTTYPDSILGIAGTTIDFLYFDGLPAPYPTVRNFYANNVAFRRGVFAEHGYASHEGVYRGHCQMLGMRLWESGVAIRWEPQARTIHELPETAREFTKLRLYRGSDAAALSREFVGRCAPGRSAALGQRRSSATLALLAGRALFSQASLGRQEMPDLSGSRSLAARAAILGVSALDSIGAGLNLLGVDLGIDDGSSISTEGRDASRTLDPARRAA